ncbi:hypothetical protein [Helicobacter sp. 23-1045]
MSLRDSAILCKILRIAESNKNQSCEAPKTRPLRGAKNREQGCSSATRRFFARSGESEALPLKAKSGSFWGHNLIVGGSGSGVQPFCEKEMNLKSVLAIDSQNLRYSFCRCEILRLDSANRRI